MVWIALTLAGFLETGFVLALKASDGFTRLLPSLAFLLCAAGSFGLLTLALKTLPAGTAYAVWTGIGAGGTALAGILLLGEPAEALRLACIGAIVAGAVGLQFASAH